jgi:hypothetical protein
MDSSFIEIQRFNKWWHYMFMLLPFVFISCMSYLILNDLIETNDGEKHPVLLILLIISSVLAGYWFYSMKLITYIDANGIEVNYKSIPFAYRKISWDEIENIETVTYSPLWEYGGWGVRWSANGWCYNVRGKKGIKIIYKNKDVFLIGTQEPESIKQLIQNYKK